MSLRAHLLLFIFVPLGFVALLLTLWYYKTAKETAHATFDRALLSSALAILRDVALTQGDAPLSFTRDIINNASGGDVFYHVTGPNGVYITGYAYPPRTPKNMLTDRSTAKKNSPSITSRPTIKANLSECCK